MDLIYYYTPEIVGAPNAIARKILENLLKRKKDWPFDSIKLVVKSKSVERSKRKFENLEVITYRNLFNTPRNCLIHIPTDPIILPNIKFLLHLYAILKNRKLILQYHGDMRIEMRQRLRYEHYINFLSIPSYVILPHLLKSANRLIVHSYFMSNLVKDKYGVKNDVVIPNAIDDFWFDESNKERIYLDGDPTIFYHGRLSPEKGVVELIKGFSKGIKDNRKTRLYIIANGPFEMFLKKLSSKLGVSKNVKFLGFMDHSKIKLYLNAADAVIYPSIYEAFSLSILEAFSSANGPVYFSKLAGIYDFAVRDGYNLNAFEPTIENISKIFQDIIHENYDKKIVVKQKEFAKRYTWDKVITQYIKVYRDIII